MFTPERRVDPIRRLLLLGGAVWGLGSRAVSGQPRADPEHAVAIDLPLLAEDPTAVPIRVSVDHPMEPDHLIQWVEVVLEGDPVPQKGRFVFGPGNGRAWVAYQMRSGTGGLVTVSARCSRHGTFVGRREVRVVDGGCTTGPDKVGRERAGRPQVRLPRGIRRGEIVEVRTRIEHNSYTGLALRNGRFVREAPEHYVKRMLVYVGEELVSEFQMTSAVSPSPVVRFPLRFARDDTLRVVFVNSEGRRWEVTEPIRLS
jgi:desulfoferrodoxin (superoxide reductase-like protein)